MDSITQEDPMGCAVACVASHEGLSYKRALKLFEKQGSASSKGYWCKEIISALEKNNKKKKYSFCKAKPGLKINEGSIVFIARSKKYPAGHYLLKTDNGWMNSWINYPKINPAKGGFQKKIPGRTEWIIYEK